MAASRADRSRLPDVGPVPRFLFPSIDRSVLANGLRVWSIAHSGVPAVALMLLVQRGSAADPPGREGLAAITADLLDEGSGGRSAIEMHEALARIGAQFDTDVGADGLALSLSVLSRFTDRGLALLADMAVRPSLAEADFVRVRQLRLHRLAQLRDVPAAVAERTFARLLYGDAPYGHTPAGTEQALAVLTVEDVRRFHRDTLAPAAATLIGVGDCPHDVLCRLAADAFGGWAGAPGVPEADANRPLPAPARLNVVPRQGAPQSELRLGHIGVARDTPDYHAIVAMNMVLGGQFVSRLNLNLRQEKGLTYGARTGFEFRRRPGPFVLQASVDTAGTAVAVQESFAEIARIRGPRPITRPELDLGVAALTRGYARNFETAEQLARALGQIALYDLPDDYFARFVPCVEAVTPEEATRAAARYLDPDRLVTLVVGDLDAIGADLARLGLGEPVVLASQPAAPGA